MRSLAVRCWFLLAFALPCPRGLIAQDIKVLVLDALDGKPQPKVKVEYFCAGSTRNSAHRLTFTDDQGFAQITNFCSDSQQIDISVYPPDKKEQCGDDPYTLKDILAVGVVGKPNAAGGIWCPDNVSKRLKPVPGQVTMFVKKPTWWQSHVAG